MPARAGTRCFPALVQPGASVGGGVRTFLSREGTYGTRGHLPWTASRRRPDGEQQAVLRYGPP
jgi:hypothetical protein